MARELANGESGAPHLRDLRDRRAALSAAWRPEPNARRPQSRSHGRGRDPEPRRDPVRADTGAIGGLQIGVGNPIAYGRSRQPGSLGWREAGSLEKVRT